MLQKIRGWYASYAHMLSYLQHPLLLAMRVYWGWTFIHSGYGKLTHLDLYAQRFAAWGIPMPEVNAVLAGATECIGGALLIAGFASRIVALPLIVVMIVAYCTAHRADVTDLYSFTTAPPFLNLLTCVIVLVFGPGCLSLDGLLSRCCRKPQTADAGMAKLP